MSVNAAPKAKTWKKANSVVDSKQVDDKLL